MRGGRRSRSKKTAAKEEPIVRVAPTRRSRAKVRRPSPPVTPKIPESVQKRIEEMMASGRMKAPTTPRKTTPRKPTARKKPVPPKVTRPKPVARRKPAVQPVRKPKPPELTSEVQKRIQEALADLNIGGSRQPKRRAAPKPPPKRKTTPRKTVAKKAAPKKPDFDITEIRSPSWARDEYLTEKPTTAEASSSQSTAPQAPTPPATQQQTGGGSFESAYVDWLQSKPSGPPRRPKGMGAASKSYQAKRKKYESDLAKWEGSEPSRATYTPPVTTAPTAPTAPVVQPDYVPPPPGEAPDKFAGRYVPPTSILGTPDMSISSNIVGQSFDPSFAASFTPPPQPPGSTFGGYGQQAPMQALAPYAGMAQNNPQPTDFFPTYIPKPEPIYETVQRPEPNRPTPRPDARPVMGAPRPVFVGPRPPSAGIGAPLGRDQITEFLSYR